MTNDKSNLDQSENSTLQTIVPETQLDFPIDPLEHAAVNEAMRRSMVAGILESYHGNYDILAELVQNIIINVIAFQNSSDHASAHCFVDSNVYQRVYRKI